jgi:RES domain-containing protein
MQTVTIGGAYLRVADPDWDDPLDPAFAARAPGQRWNPPGLECLYLNMDIATARANIARKFAGLPYGPEDLDPANAPILLDVSVPNGDALDAVSDQGLAAVDLPTSYPHQSDGTIVPHSMCQPIGQTAFDAGLDGVASRSAAAGGDQELAWYPRGRVPSAGASRRFEEWW